MVKIVQLVQMVSRPHIPKTKNKAEKPKHECPGLYTKYAGKYVRALNKIFRVYSIAQPNVGFKIDKIFIEYITLSRSVRFYIVFIYQNVNYIGIIR